MIIRNGFEARALPLRFRGNNPGHPDAGRTNRSLMTGHYFTNAWTEKIPNTSNNPWVLPMKDAQITTATVKMMPMRVQWAWS